VNFLHSKQWIRDLLLYLHVSEGLDARCSSGIADSSAKLCPHENLRFANNGPFKLAVITFLEYVIHSHSLTGEVFCGPSSPWEYVVAACGGFSRGFSKKSHGLWI
jgi:hypothetical protein